MDKLREEYWEKISTIVNGSSPYWVPKVSDDGERFSVLDYVPMRRDLGTLLQAAREDGKKEAEKDFKVEVALTNGYWIKRATEQLFGIKRFLDRPDELLGLVKYLDRKLVKFDYTSRVQHVRGSESEEKETRRILRFMRKLPKSRNMPKYLKQLDEELNLTKQKGE